MLNQSLSPLEVIIVDDASSDDTVSIVEQYSDERVRLHRCPKNGGGAVARNIGIDLALGEYIAFLDSDDVWLPQKLAYQRNQIFQARDKEKVFCFSNVICVSGSNRKIHNRIAFQKGMELSDYIFVTHQMVQTSTMILSAALARELKFNVALSRHQDWDLALRAFVGGAEFLGTDEALVEYYDNFDVKRISSHRTAGPSISWAKLAAPLLTKKAAANFYVTVVFPTLLRENPIAALSGLIKVMGPGRASAALVMRVLAKQIFPRKLIEKIRYARS